MIILFVDDDQMRHDLAEKYLHGGSNLLLHAFTYEDAVIILRGHKNQIDLLMLDHDLWDIRDGIDYNGSMLANFILNQLELDKLPKQAITHSWNYNGRLSICSKLETAGIPTQNEPFSEAMLKRVAEAIK